MKKMKGELDARNQMLQSSRPRTQNCVTEKVGLPPFESYQTRCKCIDRKITPATCGRPVFYSTCVWTGGRIAWRASRPGNFARIASSTAVAMCVARRGPWHATSPTRKAWSTCAMCLPETTHRTAGQLLSQPIFFAQAHDLSATSPNKVTALSPLWRKDGRSGCPVVRNLGGQAYKFSSPSRGAAPPLRLRMRLNAVRSARDLRSEK